MKNLITRQQEIKRTADRDVVRIEAEAEIAGLRRWLSWRRGTDGGVALPRVWKAANCPTGDRLSRCSGNRQRAGQRFGA